ncbi:thioredoxin family protein [Psychroserpens sp. SPM9]|uniref:thioredoxin family protein n=1 Tax=Psychroserpens sp. SPM9 TaxID=2975598 RepID=UPI0021A96E46|nr:thioredoxin family protein [Psychroserpens sp. SPM9]MDG5492979.1 thioredoxin family protein [Psychroserpens sp. SPM9]
MAMTPSNMLALGTKAPDFNLLNTVDDTLINLENAKGLNGTVIMFICNHCPFVKHVNETLSELAKQYISKGINCIAISSNDADKYPSDSPENMKQNAIDNDFIFPYLYDETQAVAKAYDAACTPDFYVFDKNLTLVYRGQLDDSRPGNGIPVSGKDLKNALDNILENQPVSEVQKPSIGCNIKWK